MGCVIQAISTGGAMGGGGEKLQTNFNGFLPDAKHLSLVDKSTFTSILSEV